MSKADWSGVFAAARRAGNTDLVHPLRQFHRPTLLALLVVVGLVASGCQASPADERPEPVTSPLTSTTLLVPTTEARTTSTATLAVVDVVAPVVSVTDGDTIRVLMPDGKEEPVRLIGIDAAEDGSVLGQEATAYLEELVLGKNVRMVVDVSERDRFGRLLRYVYVGALFINEEMVHAGLAIARRYEPDTAMASVLDAAQRTATTITTTTTTAPTTTTRAHTTTTTQPPTTTTTVAVTTTTAAVANCHSSYEGVCLKVGQGDYDCAGGSGNGPNYVQGPVYVVGPDEFDLDRDGDGVGCES